MNNQNSSNSHLLDFILLIGAIIFLLIVKPFLGVFLLFCLLFIFFVKTKITQDKFLSSLKNYFTTLNSHRTDTFTFIQNILSTPLEQINFNPFSTPSHSLTKLNESFQSNNKIKLKRHQKYLHIALNSNLEEAQAIITHLPFSERILIEVGTPLIKIYGAEAITQIKAMVPSSTYLIADNKCADLAAREVAIMANAGANAATCLGVAPIETINAFIEECQKFNIDSIIDMMNVNDVLAVLKQLKKLPDVVMLHRGVDETEFSKEKQIPYYQIQQIKSNYDLLIAVAGGDTINEVQKAIFNGADIVVVWKDFYHATSQTIQLVESFLKEIK